MRTLRAAIVDDEPLARARLARLLGAEPLLELVGQFGDGDAAEALAAAAADVVFLDVRMPGRDGFAMLERLPPPRRPLVVFVSAYSQHALRAFDSEAVDYLVKPVSAERLRVSVARVRERVAALARTTKPIDGSWVQRLAVPDGGRMRIVAVADIECAIAQGNYVELRLPGRTLLLRDTMSALEAKLDPSMFVRIHRSRIVRIDMIEHVEPYGAGQSWLRLRNGTCMTSGRGYRAQLRGVLGLGAPATRGGAREGGSGAT